MTFYSIFRSIKFTLSPKLNIVDALWHKKESDDCVVCLTDDYYLRFFKVKNPKIQFKEYHLANVISQSNLEQVTNEKSGIKLGNLKYLI